MFCRHCEYRCHARLMADEFPAFCPRCGCPRGVPLNYPLVLSGEMQAGDILRQTLAWNAYSSVRVLVNGVEYMEDR